MALALGGSLWSGSGVTLAWDPSPDERVAGYAIYYSATAGNPILSPGAVRQDAGLRTSVTITNLTPGGTYHFVAIAYTADGLESLPSNEVVYAVPERAQVSPTNQPPDVAAGADQFITLSSPAVLTGSVFDDGLPSTPGEMSRQWSVVSGPGPVTFGSSTALSTTVSFSTPGFYLLRLTATDGELSAFDDLAITVAPHTPLHPFCLKGTDWPSGVLVTDSVFDTDQSAQVVLRADNGGAGPMVRIQPGCGAGYLLYPNNSNTFTIYKVTDDGRLDFAPVGDSFSAACSTGNVLKLKVTGSEVTTLEFFLNGVSQGYRCDWSRPYTSGQPGVYVREAGFAPGDFLAYSEYDQTFSDTFVRGPSNPMSDPDNGGAWASALGTLNDMEISPDGARGLAPCSGAQLTEPIFPDDQSAQITLGNPNWGVGVYVRMDSFVASGYLLHADDSNTLTIYKVTDDGRLGFAAMPPSFMASLGAGDTIRLKATGTGTVTLEVFLNGTPLGPRTDATTPYTGGQPGIFANAGCSLSCFTAKQE